MLTNTLSKLRSEIVVYELYVLFFSLRQKGKYKIALKFR